MSDDPTFFFMHIMKTGGTSFAQHVEASFPAEQVYPPPGSDRHAEQYWKVKEVTAVSEEDRRVLRAYHGHFPFVVGDMVGADVTLTVLRDPVERVISHLRHCRRHFDRHHGRPLTEIYEDPWHHPTLFRDYQVKQLAFTAADAPKGHIDVLEIDERRFALAVENLDRLTVLGLTDRLDEMRQEVSSRFGWRVDGPERLQVSPGAARIPDALRRLIATDSAADVAFYEEAVARYDARRRERRRRTRWLGRLAERARR